MEYIYVFLIIAAYLLGSIPSAVWISRKFYGMDIRDHGSRNAGATNTLRILGPKAALPVFIIDFAKGFGAVMLAYTAGFEDGSPQMFNLKFALVAAAVLGHIFPVFARFRGGKGVATLAGAVLAVYPPSVLLCLATFIVVFALTNYVSVASMTSGIALPLYTAFVFHQTYIPLLVFCSAVSLLLLFTHRKNIGRLARGEENKTYLFRNRNSKKRPGGEGGL